MLCSSFVSRETFIKIRNLRRILKDAKLEATI